MADRTKLIAGIMARLALNKPVAPGGTTIIPSPVNSMPSKEDPQFSSKETPTAAAAPQL